MIFASIIFLLPNYFFLITNEYVKNRNLLEICLACDIVFDDKSLKALKLGGFDIGISLIMQNNIILVRCGATDFYVLVYPMKKMY